MARPVIALLSDFGLADHYVGAMKGVVAGLCPDAALIDVTHDVPPHDVLAGALSLESAADAFPSGTIFLAVVDPGVGTARLGIAARVGPWTFVGPDNGLVTLLWRAHEDRAAFELADPRFRRTTLSRTFEGRDRFAPAAAWLARGTPLEAFGPGVERPVLIDVPEARLAGDALEGEVLVADRFGNLVTSIRRASLEAWTAGAAAAVEAGGHAIGPVRGTYGEVAAGEPCALVGSSDRLEIACNGRSARAGLGLDPGAPVRVRLAR